MTAAELKTRIEARVREVVEYSTSFCLDVEEEREALIDAVTCEVLNGLMNDKGTGMIQELTHAVDRARNSEEIWKRIACSCPALED
jgi:hypothetical protein